MNRSLAALSASAMILASSPLAFAQDASSASSSSSSSSTSSVSSVSSSAASSTASTTTSETSSSRGNDWKRPCEELKGLLKAQCIVKHNPGRGNKKDRQTRMNDDKALRLSSDCKEKEGAEKVQCIRTHGKKGIKTFIKKTMKHHMMRTVRGKKVEESESSED